MRTRERQAEPVARGASLVALDGEVSWHWQDYFRVAAATQAAVHKFEVPVCWGGCGNSLLAIASPEDSVADYVAACRATGQKPFFLDGPHFELQGPAGMINWIKTVQGWRLSWPRSARPALR